MLNVQAFDIFINESLHRNMRSNIREQGHTHTHTHRYCVIHTMLCSLTVNATHETHWHMLLSTAWVAFYNRQLVVHEWEKNEWREHERWGADLFWTVQVCVCVCACVNSWKTKKGSFLCAFMSTVRLSMYEGNSRLDTCNKFVANKVFQQKLKAIKYFVKREDISWELMFQYPLHWVSVCLP